VGEWGAQEVAKVSIAVDKRSRLRFTQFLKLWFKAVAPSEERLPLISAKSLLIADPPARVVDWIPKREGKPGQAQSAELEKAIREIFFREGRFDMWNKFPYGRTQPIHQYRLFEAAGQPNCWSIDL
jgi:hypothetical protein